jgi:hypothetical protein
MKSRPLVNLVLISYRPILGQCILARPYKKPSIPSLALLCPQS